MVTTNPIAPLAPIAVVNVRRHRNGTLSIETDDLTLIVGELELVWIDNRRLLVCSHNRANDQVSGWYEMDDPKAPVLVDPNFAVTPEMVELMDVWRRAAGAPAQGPL